MRDGRQSSTYHPLPIRKCLRNSDFFYQASILGEVGRMKPVSLDVESPAPVSPVNQRGPQHSDRWSPAPHNPSNSTGLRSFYNGLVSALELVALRVTALLLTKTIEQKWEPWTCSKIPLWCFYTRFYWWISLPSPWEGKLTVRLTPSLSPHKPEWNNHLLRSFTKRQS